LLLKPIASAVSIGTLLTAPAFGFMGIGFPRLGMNAFAYAYGALLPGTWYLTARIDQTVRGTPIDLSWKPLLILLAFTLALVGLVAWRLDSIRSAADRSSRARTAPLVEVPS
jgi:ABC-2 type transport system permease protein